MYDFESDDFGISNTGIHLLRSRYNYKTIPFDKVDKAVFKKAVEIKRPLLSLITGMALTLLAFLNLIWLYEKFNNPAIHVFYIEEILLPLFPMLAGIYLLYISFKKGPVLFVEIGKEKNSLRLKDLKKKGQMEDLKEYLNKKLDFRFVVQDGI